MHSQLLGQICDGTQRFVEAWPFAIDHLRNDDGVKLAVFIWEWLLLDSRVVDVLMAYNSTFARLFSVKP